MTKEELKEVIDIITTHRAGEGEFCDTGEDMGWKCRSECIELAVERLKKFYEENPDLLK